MRSHILWHLVNLCAVFLSILGLASNLFDSSCVSCVKTYSKVLSPTCFLSLLKLPPRLQDSRLGDGVKSWIPTCLSLKTW